MGRQGGVVNRDPLPVKRRVFGDCPPSATGSGPLKRRGSTTWSCPCGGCEILSTPPRDTLRSSARSWPSRRSSSGDKVLEVVRVHPAEVGPDLRPGAFLGFLQRG